MFNLELTISVLFVYFESPLIVYLPNRFIIRLFTYYDN